MPWLIAGIIAAVGGIVGVLISSKSSAMPVPSAQKKMHLLRKGSAGPEVVVWRGILGLPTNENDFDDDVLAATIDWQKKRGLTPDGLVGHDSWTTAGYGFESAPAKSAGVPKAKPPGTSNAANASVGPSITAASGGGEGGHAWAKSLPLESTMAQGAILAAFDAGFYLLDWVPLTLRANGHELTIEVSARALRIGNANDSIAVDVTYGTAQAIANRLDAYLPTPHIADAIFHAADLKILPYPNRNAWVTDGTMGHTNRMVEHSDAMDAKGVLSAKLVSNEGKYWTVSIRIWTDPEPKKHNGPNYGFFDAQGVPVQHVGMAHGRHTDYSQKGYFVKRMGTLDGAQQIDLADVAADPALAPLISDEGALPAMIHPNWQNL